MSVSLGVVCVALTGFSGVARAQDVQEAVEALETENAYQDEDLVHLFEATDSHTSRLDTARAEREAARAERLASRDRADRHGETLDELVADLADRRQRESRSSALTLKELARQVTGVVATSVVEATASLMVHVVDELEVLGDRVDGVEASQLTKDDVRGVLDGFAKGDFEASYGLLVANDGVQDGRLDQVEASLLQAGADIEVNAVGVSELGGQVAELEGAFELLDNDLLAVTTDLATVQAEVAELKDKITLATDTGEILIRVDALEDTTGALATRLDALEERSTPSVVAPVATWEGRWQAVTLFPGTTEGLEPDPDPALPEFGFGYGWSVEYLEEAVRDASRLISEDGVSCYAVDDLGEPSKAGTLDDGTLVEVCVANPEYLADYAATPGQILVDPMEFIVLAWKGGGAKYESSSATTVKGSKIDLNP